MQCQISSTSITMMLEGFAHSFEHLVLVAFSVVSFAWLFLGATIFHESEIECGP